MACKDCLTRREFLTRSAAAAAALAALEACGDGQIGPTSVALGSGLTVNLADFPALATMGVLVDVGHQRAVIRTGPAAFVALSRICTHEGCEAFVRSNRVECDCHGSIFANNGAVLRGPAERPLDMLNVQFDATTNTLTIA